MKITWLSAFIDLPQTDHADGVAFWEAVSATTRSGARGERGQFATLEPSSGTAHLRVQQLDLDSPRIHLDLHVDDIDAAVARATGLGATVISHDGYAVMSSPSGYVFCFVDGAGMHDMSPAVSTPAPHQVDQVCIDIPSAQFAAEVEFWHQLTEWDLGKTVLPEFQSLLRPDELPIRIILQALGVSDHTQAHAHLDISCGESVAEVATHHVSLGAVKGEEHQYWTIMADPVGMLYCLTRRDPPAAS